MKNIIVESEVEQLTLDILSNLDYTVLSGPDIAPDGVNPERSDYYEVVLIQRLKDAIDRMNSEIPSEAKEEALKQVLRVDTQNLIENNRSFHGLLVNGVDVEYRVDGLTKVLSNILRTVLSNILRTFSNPQSETRSGNHFLHNHVV